MPSIDGVHLSYTAGIYLAGMIAGIGLVGIAVAIADWISYMINPLHRWR